MSRRMKKASERTALLDHLDEGGPAGVDEGGQPWVVRGAPLGATVRLRTGRKNKGQLLAVVEPAADAVAPVCPVFGLCGGCQLQASPLSRQRLAKAEDVPSYVVAPNKTHEDMARRRPTSKSAMTEVFGMGPERFKRYGSAFLEAVRGWTGC